MEHVKRLVLVPEHMADQRKKPLVSPLTARVQEIDSDMQDIMQRQDIPIDAQGKMYDQNLQRYLAFYDKRMNKPLRVNMIKPTVPEEKEKAHREQIEEKPDEIETDILDSVPATMKSRTRQLIKKLKACANKDIIGWNEQGQMVFKGTTIPGTNIVDLVNDSLRQRKSLILKDGSYFQKRLVILMFPRVSYETKIVLDLFESIKPRGFLKGYLNPPPH